MSFQVQSDLEIKCKDCGSQSYYEDEGFRFCSDCGTFEKLTTQATQTESQPLSQSFLIKEMPKPQTSRAPTSAEKIAALTDLTYNLAVALSHHLSSPDLFKRIGQLWTIYIFRIKQKMGRWESRKKSPGFYLYNPTKIKTLQICFIAIKTLGLNFTFMDLKKLIINGTIDFINWKHKHQELVNDDKNDNLPNQDIDGDGFFTGIETLGNLIPNDLEYFVNYRILIERYILELNLSENVSKLSLVVQELFCDCHKFRIRANPNCCYYLWAEIYSIVIVIYSARLYFSVGWFRVDWYLKPKRVQYQNNIKQAFKLWKSRLPIREICADEFICNLFTTDRFNINEINIDEDTIENFIDFLAVSYPETTFKYALL